MVYLARSAELGQVAVICLECMSHIIMLINLYYEMTSCLESAIYVWSTWYINERGGYVLTTYILCLLYAFIIMRSIRNVQRERKASWQGRKAQQAKMRKGGDGGMEGQEKINDDCQQLS